MYHLHYHRRDEHYLYMHPQSPNHELPRNHYYRYNPVRLTHFRYISPSRLRRDRHLQNVSYVLDLCRRQ
jgi:hypothetical protein